MKVIFLKDVARVAQRDTVKEVSDGYALNFLIPQGLAEQASDAKIRAHEERLKAHAAAMSARESEWREWTKKINGSTIRIAARANDKGHLYTQLSPEAIIGGIRDAHGINLPREAIVLKHPIKTLGKVPLDIRLGSSTAIVSLDIVAS